MPKFTIKTEDGRSATINADREPTPDEVDEILKQIPSSKQVKTENRTQQGAEISQDRRSLLTRAVDDLKNKYESAKEWVDKPDSGGFTPKDKAKVVAQGALTGTAMLADLAIPQGIPGRPAISGGIWGGTEFLNKKIEGATNSEAKKSAIISGGIAAATPMVVQGAIAGGKAILTPIARPLIQSKVAQRLIPEIEKKINQFKSYIDDVSHDDNLKSNVIAKVKRQGELQQQAASKKLSGISENIAEQTRQLDPISGAISKSEQSALKSKEYADIGLKAKAALQGNQATSGIKIGGSINKKDIYSAIDEIANKSQSEIESSALSAASRIHKTKEEIKKTFNTAYNELTKGPQGNIQVDVSDEVQMLSEALNIPKTTPKEALPAALLSKIKQVSDESGDTTIVNDFQKAVSDMFDTSQEGKYIVKAKHSHWLKQAVNDIADKMKGSSNQEYGYELSNIAKSVSNKTDEALGGEYSELNKRYWMFKNDDEFISKQLGHQETVSGVSRRANALPSVEDAATALAKQQTETGSMAYSDYLLGKSKKLDAIRANVDLLRRQGLHESADAIESDLMDTARNMVSKEKILQTRAVFDDIMKEIPAAERAEVSLIAKEVPQELYKQQRQIEESIAKMTTESKRVSNLMAVNKSETENAIYRLNKLKSQKSTPGNLSEIDKLQKKIDTLKENKGKLKLRIMPDRMNISGLHTASMLAFPIGMAVGMPQIGAYVSGIAALSFLVKNKPYLANGALKALGVIEKKMVPYAKDATALGMYFDDVRNHMMESSDNDPNNYETIEQ